jgi:hypothetical protein
MAASSLVVLKEKSEGRDFTDIVPVVVPGNASAAHDSARRRFWRLPTVGWVTSTAGCAYDPLA